MKYRFSFYQNKDYDRLIELVLKSYEWETPIVGLSRVEFSHGLHPEFTGFRHAWEHTVGMYWEGDLLVGCVWNEGTYEGDVFFLFESKERAGEIELLKEMINFAKMYGVGIPESHKRELNITIPKWNTELMRLGEEIGLQKGGWPEHFLMLPFSGQPFEVKLPDGYTIIDGHTSPDFYLSNVHRMSFGYGASQYACEHGAAAFHELRTMGHYDKDLDLCILDPLGRPCAFAILWYDPKMPYCELEPLGVVWWERRKGLATAILHEGANRVMSKYPMCRGMKGGDQDFYLKIGYENKGEIWAYHWEREVFISWEAESKNQDYASEMKW